MRGWAVLGAAAALAGCGDVRDFETTQAHFAGHRAAYEALVEKVRRCRGVVWIGADEPDGAPCAGDAVLRTEIVADLKLLGLKGASRSEDGGRVELVNGTDGTPLGVMSGVAYDAAAGSAADERALTPPPHRWRYVQHD